MSIGPSSGVQSRDIYHEQHSLDFTSSECHGIPPEKPWDQEHHYKPQAGDLHESVDSGPAPDCFVFPEEVYIPPYWGDWSHDGFDSSIEDSHFNGYGYPQTVPTMSQQCRGRQDREHAYDEATLPTGVFPPHHDNSPEHEHSQSLGEVPGQSLLVGARKSRREKALGRSAAKKAKEKKTKKKKICPEHPGKVFIRTSDYRKHMNQQHLRPFLCVFYFAGCIQNFGSKDEWKRHVYSQHLQISYWNCDDSMCADRKAIFNRKDLFGQHIKRMHLPPTCSKASVVSYIEEVADRCRVERRKPPQDGRCGYCNQTFSGPHSWDQRMEHVGRHYEKNYKGIFSDRRVPDEGLIAWSLEHGIIEDNGNGVYSIVSYGKEAAVKAGIEQRKLVEKEMANGDDVSTDSDHH